jgi:hypothetical protein
MQHRDIVIERVDQITLQFQLPSGCNSSSDLHWARTVRMESRIVAIETPPDSPDLLSAFAGDGARPSTPTAMTWKIKAIHAPNATIRPKKKTGRTSNNGL